MNPIMNVTITSTISAIIPEIACPAIANTIKDIIPKIKPHTVATAAKTSANGIISIESMPNHAYFTFTKFNLTPPIIGAKKL